MVVNLKKLLDGDIRSLTFEQTEDLSDLELYGVRPFPDGLLVRGTIEKRTGLITLELTLEAELETLCSTCGRLFRSPFSVTEHYMLAKTMYEENDEILLYADDQLDLTEVVRDLAVINMEMQPKCSPTCKGVCFTCGANLNDGPCRCQTAGKTNANQ